MRENARIEGDLVNRINTNYFRYQFSAVDIPQQTLGLDLALVQACIFCLISIYQSCHGILSCTGIVAITSPHK